MKTIAIVSCALVAASCADAPPPRDPSGTVHTTAAQSPSPQATPPASPIVHPEVTMEPPPPPRTHERNLTDQPIEDRAGQEQSKPPTAADQGSGAVELEITAAIRKSLVGSKSLSLKAKNVTIITKGTKVTLRGSVDKESERAEIEKIAETTPGVTDVDDRLDVKR